MPRTFPRTTGGESIAIASMSNGNLSVSILNHPAFELDQKNSALLITYLTAMRNNAIVKKALS